MTKCLNSLQTQFNSLRAGSCSPALVEHILVRHGSKNTPIVEVARITKSGPMELTIHPLVSELAPVIDSAITADIGTSMRQEGSSGDWKLLVRML